MLVLQATAKILRTLPRTPGPDPTSDTVLGDWLARGIVVGRRPLLVLVSERGFLPAVIPARGVKDLPAQLADLLGDRLRRLGLDAADVDAEVHRMRQVHVTGTHDRRLLGLAVEYGHMAQAGLPAGWTDQDLPDLEARLANTPCLAGSGQAVFPRHAVPALLRSSQPPHRIDNPTA